jgi:STE24 endopeptidase
MAATSFAGLAILGLAITQPWLYQGLGITHPSNHTALMLFLLAGPVFTFFLQPLYAWGSRRHEFEADDFAAKQTNARNLISALVKLYRENAATLTPDPLYSSFYDTHPPALRRINHLLGK